MTLVPAARPCSIVIRDDDNALTYVPVVAFEIINSIAFPITPLPIRGLLSGRRALEIDGMFIDRAVGIPFASADEWLNFCANTTPEEEPEATGDTEDATVRFTSDGRTEEIPENERAKDMAARLQRQNANIPKTDVTDAGGKKAAARTEAAKKRKAFASNSWWGRQRADGLMEAVQIDKGWGLPLDHEGWEKIKREEFAEFKKASKLDEPTAVILTWSETDGLVEETAETPAGDDALDDDISDLV